MSKDKPPTEQRFGQLATSRRDVLKILGAGAGVTFGGLSAGSAAARSSSVTTSGGEFSVSESEAGVTPKSVSVQLAPGESTTIEKKVVTPALPPKLDVFLLEDETGSFGDDIANLRNLAPGIWDSIAGATDPTPDFRMGVGGFRDYAQDGWGSPGDWVYDLDQDLTDDKTAFVNGVNSLTASGGADGPEGYLEALHYIATDGHAAIDSNGDGDTNDSNDTPANLGPNWRADATKVVLLATDNTCHVEGDAGGWPGHQSAPNLDIAAAVAALDDAGITVIGLTPSSISCVNQLAAGTGGSVQSTDASGSEIGDAILAGLTNLSVEVTPVLNCDDGLSIVVSPSSKTVTSGEAATFDETISVDADPPIDGNEDTLSCTVDWLINGESAGEEFVEEVDVEVCADVVVDLVAGQNEVIGTVTVSEEDGNITVMYSLDGDWYMTESHLHLATDCGDIPHTGAGNPKVGQFEYSRNYSPAVQKDTFVVDKSSKDFTDDDTLCIAAHAAVFEDANGDGYDKDDREETAWGEGDRFVERGNWAMHFEYEVCD